jgi:hypothetical protein
MPIRTAALRRETLAIEGRSTGQVDRSIRPLRCGFNGAIAGAK